jgi:hypothetical protein
MLIDIPVTIIFDDDGSHKPAGPDRTMKRTFTMRYDTTDSDREAEFAMRYGNSLGTFSKDRDGVLFAFLSSEMDRVIKEEAEQDPESYRAEVAP